ncbi:MAG: hypothetical protein OQJ96_05925 [Flavobacteriales bacterium]|nr:hypothetical protein [Flavobacteriales bacterium]MCW8937615.1 hypothetical protein [Flavobacteriales bacterium]MCW8968979.1 hypothetical protein [Flavobacteriales bacterium]MCW8990103.1 hypothetical protein [Flavobacteriales bacterium]MCW9019821.1 hypothetical protein [Flavobacteriales bacterium]
MNFINRYANLFKLASLVIGVVAFVFRILYGELNETHVVREITGELRMGGSSVGYVLISIIILSIISFVIFNELSKKKN